MSFFMALFAIYSNLETQGAVYLSRGCTDKPVNDQLSPVRILQLLHTCYICCSSTVFLPPQHSLLQLRTQTEMISWLLDLIFWYKMFSDLSSYWKGNSVHFCLFLFRNLAKEKKVEIQLQQHDFSPTEFIKTAYVCKEQVVIDLVG